MLCQRPLSLTGLGKLREEMDTGTLLQEVKDRILKSPPKRELDPVELLLHDIRQQPKLRPVKDGRLVVETSRTKLNNEDDTESPLPVRKVIKPDFNLLRNFEDDTDESECSLQSSRRSSMASPSPEREMRPWQRAVVRDLATTQSRPVILQRRNTITVCESPVQKWSHPIECLSLTLEEVTHIRTVLTKADLESAITQKDLYTLLAKGKICFTCKEVKFSMFGQWGTRCKICKRNVCNNCLRKMNVPTEHFENIPVHTLSPIPLSPETLDIIRAYESTGSVPHSPTLQRKQQQKLETKSVKPKTLQRANTFTANQGPAMLPNKNLLKGPQMNICRDCKGMIMEIIRTSRTSIALINQGKELPKKSDSSSSDEGGSGKNLSSLSLNVKHFFNPSKE